MTLVLLAIALAAASGVPAVLLSRSSRVGERVAAAVMIAAAATGTAGALRSVLASAAAPSGERLFAAWRVPGGELALRLDPIAATFLVPIFVVGGLVSVYGLAYWPQVSHPEDGRKLRLFHGLLTASMALVVVADNAMLFLFGWETMALAAFFLITTEDGDPAVTAAGYVYLVATHVGTLALFAMFAVLHATTGTWRFDAPAAAPSIAVANVVFALALVGFGVKAGLMPLHVWLPGAHASSPSHVSAFMSGVMITMGVYGLVRVTSFFDAPPLFWGFVLLGVGAVSAVLGVAFAIAQGDLKRLLAYSTVEGAGVVALGLGTALVGRSLGRPELVTLGLAGALLHVWNHAAFKSLLFFGAGAVIHATGTREIDGLGGLARRMPLTASTFLAGSIALCGLPPSNGFVSELLVYLGLFHTALLPDRDAWMAGAFGVPVLALVGAVSLACFVKAYGVVFLGAPRGDRAERAHDPGPAMTGPALALGGACAVLGLAPSLVAPLLDRATAAWSPGGAAVAPSLASLAPLHAVSVTSACLVVAIVAAALLLRRATGGARARRAPTWDCGYAMPTARMQYTGSSFAATLVTMFAWALRPRIRRPVVKALFPIAAPSQRFSADVPDAVLERALAPALRAAGRGLAWFRWVQQGNVRLYVLYIVAAAVLAVVLLPR